MKNLLLTIKLLTFTLISISSNSPHAQTVLPAHNGIKYPVGLKNWRVLGSSYRSDNKTQRIILGNSIAIKASNSGHTNPWPRGSILAKLVWKNIKHPRWRAAIVPGKFVHTEIMIKNTSKYPSTGGWGYARWEGSSLTPSGKDKYFSKECLACHLNTKENDYVFTIPVKIP